MEVAVPEFVRLSAPLREVEVDAVAVFAAKADDVPVLGAAATELAAALGVDLAAELEGVRFTGAAGQLARIPSRGAIAAPLVLVVGLGDRDTVDLETLRRGAGTAARNAGKTSSLALAGAADLLADSETDAAAVVSTVVEGAGLGAYAFTRHRSKSPDTPELTTVHVATADLADGAAEAALAEGRVVVRAQSLVRDLVNTPPAFKRPPALAEQVRGLAEEAGLTVTVFDRAALEEGGFGGILGVGQGSSEEPRMVELTWEPADATGHVVLVGKGITFDTGGISLKPSTSMVTMKSDMAGAAAVLGAMTALRDLGVTVKVTGLLALAENMPSGTAIRVSDVLTLRGGTTVEVMNTDAEGRLVLGDALAYGAEQVPDAMIDLATLTGAQIVALGNAVSGLMGTDDALIAELKDAAAEAGEQVWELPLPPEYRDHLDSTVADLKNIGKPMQAGTIVAGLFLKEFVGDVPWAHLDIAGPSFTEEGDGFYTHKGGTGVMVRTLLRYLRGRSATAADAAPVEPAASAVGP